MGDGAAPPLLWLVEWCAVPWPEIAARIAEHEASVQEHPVAGRLAAGSLHRRRRDPGGEEPSPYHDRRRPATGTRSRCAYPLVQAGLRRSSIRQWRVTKQAAGFLQPTLNRDGER